MQEKAYEETSGNELGIEGRETSGTFVLFPSVCYRVRYQGVADMNTELERLILGLEREQAGMQANSVSIKGGFHSDTQLLEHKHPAIRRLRALIENDIKAYVPMFWQSESRIPLAEVGSGAPFRMKLWGWAVVMRDGDTSAHHFHPNAHVSGVYYVAAPDKEEGSVYGAGRLALCDPRTHAHGCPIVGQITTANVQPDPGSAVLFPSYLGHYVLPFRGAGHRISIAFNVRFEGAAVNAT
jgi:uncharacterized protein (TIGR02466 family)